MTTEIQRKRNAARKKKLSGSYNILSEFSISPALNHVLKAAMGFERMLIRQGVTFPFGGSLLIVGQRLGQVMTEYSPDADPYDSLVATEDLQLTL